MPPDGRLRAWLEVQDDAVLAAFVGVPGATDARPAVIGPIATTPRDSTLIRYWPATGRGASSANQWATSAR